MKRKWLRERSKCFIIIAYNYGPIDHFLHIRSTHCFTINFRWDAFNQNEEGRGSASEMHTDLIKKASYCLKITTSLITFILVFVAACISKGALFFMIANISPPSFINGTNSNLSLVSNPPLQYCPAYVPTSASDKTYYVHFDETQSISWMS